MYLIIDNYDSFTYNLFQYLNQLLEREVRVVRNDRITIQEIEELSPEGILISPGPGRPEQAGISVECIRHFAGKVPILGVCLGHQAIGYAFGARIVGARSIVHGKTNQIMHDGKGLFRNIPSPARFTRYHSLVIQNETLPEELEITATSDDGEIMGVRHREHSIEGIQFHPESIASEYGIKLLKNFIHYKREPFNVSTLISKLLSADHLSEAEASSFMEELTHGELTDIQIAAFLTAFDLKRVSPNEIVGFASVLQRLKKRLRCTQPLLDTCGTGGDGIGSFNISSMAAIVASACGAYVAKHGNRGVSSPSGSADFFKNLDVPISLSPEQATELLEKTGFTFLFAPLYHQSMKHAAQVRRELGIKTVMNLLGPLLNPADAEYQLIGVFSEELCIPIAEASKLLGKKRVMVVHGLDGMDEISVCRPTRIVEIDSTGELRDYLFDPEEIGIRPFEQSELMGGEAQVNASMAREFLETGKPEAVREAVLVNTAAALYLYQMAADIREGYERARDALDSGKVAEKLDRIVREGRRILKESKETISA